MICRHRATGCRSVQSPVISESLSRRVTQPGVAVGPPRCNRGNVGTAGSGSENGESRCCPTRSRAVATPRQTSRPEGQQGGPSSAPIAPHESSPRQPKPNATGQGKLLRHGPALCDTAAIKASKHEPAARSGNERPGEGGSPAGASRSKPAVSAAGAGAAASASNLLRGTAARLSASRLCMGPAVAAARPSRLSAARLRAAAASWAPSGRAFFAAAAAAAASCASGTTAQE
jgi:hypothetical protein